MNVNTAWLCFPGAAQFVPVQPQKLSKLLFSGTCLMSVWLYDILKPAAAPPTYSKNKSEGFCGFMSALYANIHIFKCTMIKVKNILKFKVKRLVEVEVKSEIFQSEQKIQVRLNRKISAVTILCFSINRLVWSGSVDNIWISITQIF